MSTTLPGTSLFLAEFDSVQPELHLTLDDARAYCDDIAKAVANGQAWDWSRNEDGVYVQFWTHADDDRALHFTGGEVTELRVQPSETAPDFFRPGQSYKHGPWVFRCDTITTHPETGERRALGWFRTSENKWVTADSDQVAWDTGVWETTGKDGAS
ncbi:hypothetical protein ACFY40_11385 [Streptomyces sp. NPDC012950]|uniref:hypothetical protein n=1 Tax=Streptomyces sp. NPDC012950 TaxID=3364858 RepID=UPI0036C52B62